MSGIERSIRLSQLVSSFGIGAIYDILGESLVLCDSGRWTDPAFRGRGRELKADRLVRDLQRQGYTINRLCEPAKKPSFFQRGAGKLPYMRFPRWLFCPKCRRMVRWEYHMEREGKTPTCSTCRGKRKLTPMRFVVICPNGHMGDVPWPRWAHSKPDRDDQRSCHSPELEFLTSFGEGGGLASVAVRCRRCGAHRSLDGLTAPNALARIGEFCPGKQPWEAGNNAGPCTEKTHVVQRGAGNVYYPAVRSALTIPPESNAATGGGADSAAEIRAHPSFSLLEQAEGNGAVEAFLIGSICRSVGCTEEEVLRLLRGNGSGDGGADPEAGIETDEWNALITPIADFSSRDLFVTRHTSLYRGSPDEQAPELRALSDLIDKVVAVVKLREVRALTGYYRYHPGGGGDGGRLVKPDLGRGENWLPAAEVFGEGVFITLNEDALGEWERTGAVVARAQELEAHRRSSIYAPILPEATPRFVLLHTLAHLLIRRLAFECGYSSASLRERLYSSVPEQGTPRAGILIYTAAGDAEGTLGGLVRQADPPRLARTLFAALEDAARCSSDPICMESPGQGLEGMNRAACHACSLVAETSCTTLNLLLDRALIVGNEQAAGGSPVTGFFAEPLRLALESAVSQLA